MRKPIKTASAQQPAGVRGLSRCCDAIEQAECCAPLIQQLLDDIHIDTRLADFGVTEKDIDKLTQVALTGYQSDIDCHPLAVSEEDIKQIYRECL